MATYTQKEAEQFVTGLKQWSKDHELRYSGRIKSLAYDPTIYHGQAIENPVIPCYKPNPILPDCLVAEIKRRRLYKVMGGDAARQLIDTINTQPAFEGSCLSVKDVVHLTLQNGGNVALACAHLEGLEDVGYAHAGFSIAMHYHGGQTVAGKVTALEALDETPIPEKLSSISEVVFVIPDTSSTERYSLPQNVTNHVNIIGLKAILHKNAEGGNLVTMAPSGKVCQLKSSADGQIAEIIMPEPSQSTLKLLNRFELVVPVTISCKLGKVAIGEIIFTGKNLCPNYIIDKLSENTTRLTGGNCRLGNFDLDS